MYTYGKFDLSLHHYYGILRNLVSLQELHTYKICHNFVRKVPAKSTDHLQNLTSFVTECRTIIGEKSLFPPLPQTRLFK